MKNKCFSILLILVLIFCNVINVFAFETGEPYPNVSNYMKDSPSKLYADNLYVAGLLKGTINGSYELDRTANRAEAVTMLVRLLGKEEEAQKTTWDLPFNDVASWAVPYVGYAYSNGLTKGISDSKFGSNLDISEQQYSTFMLRALGYSEENNDFRYSSASDSFRKITDYSFNEQKVFYRQFMVSMSYYTLKANVKDSDVSLAEKLGVGFVQTYKLETPKHVYFQHGEESDHPEDYAFFFPQKDLTCYEGLKDFQNLYFYNDYIINIFAMDVTPDKKYTTLLDYCKGYMCPFADDSWFTQLAVKDIKGSTGYEYELWVPCEDNRYFAIGNEKEVLYLGCYPNFKSWVNDRRNTHGTITDNTNLDILYLRVKEE